MNRRTARNNAFLALFSMSFGDGVGETFALGQEVEDYPIDEFGEDLLRLYFAHANEVNAAIETRLKGWTVERISRVNLALLRLAITEMTYAAPGMDSVVINEAVELAKTYGDGDDYQFVNGLLGRISRENLASEGKGTPSTQIDTDEKPS